MDFHGTVRSRLVAMETPYRSSTDPNDWNARIAETPPLKAFRPQMSMAMSNPKPESENDELICEFLPAWPHHGWAVVLQRSPIVCSHVEIWWLSVTGTTAFCWVRDVR